MKTQSLISALPGFRSSRRAATEPPAPPAASEPTDRVETSGERPEAPGRANQTKHHHRLAKTTAIVTLAVVGGMGIIQATPAGQVLNGVDSPTTFVSSAEHWVQNGIMPLLNNNPGAPGPTANLSTAQQNTLVCEADQGNPQARAVLSWQALERQMGNPSGDIRGESNSWITADVWPYGQAMTAALDQASATGNYATFNAMVQHLQIYREGNGYSPATNGVSGYGTRWYDDNAWLGLSLMQAYHQNPNPQDKAMYLQNAKQIFSFIQSGLQSKGLPWDEGPSGYNTCDEMPAIELALQLHMATAVNPHDTDTPYFHFAQKVYQDVQKQGLEQSNGLFADSVNASNFKDMGMTEWSYNQGTAIGANVLFYQITGQHSYLQAAQKTANAAVKYYSSDARAEKQGADFQAIFFRNLMKLDSVAPNPAYHQAMLKYANLMWNQSRNPATGLFSGGGSTDGHTGLLQQAGMVQIYSLLSQPMLNSSVT